VDERRICVHQMPEYAELCHSGLGHLGKAALPFSPGCSRPGQLPFHSNRSINRAVLSTALTRKSGNRLLRDFISAKTTCELVVFVMW
jgi:hypothetical protein